MIKTQTLTLPIPHKFKCRDYQIPAWEALLAGKKRIVCAWHRGAGKDLFALNWVIWQALQQPAVYLHCFPQYSQGKKAIWNSIHNTHMGEPMSYLDHFPPEIVKHKNSTEMRIELINGSIYAVMGIDGKNAQLARGMNPTHVIISEYAYMDPQSWYTIEPRVKPNNGTVLFLSTPNGKNHFYDLYNYAKTDIGEKNGYFASFVDNNITQIYDNAFFEELRAQGRPEDFIQQEYFCDFNRGAEGSYYGKLIQQAREEDRILDIAIASDLPVCTSWDIGVGDSTSIWFYQHTHSGKVHLINYYENHGEGLEHYLRYLDKWKDDNKAIYGSHFVPHDMANKQFATGNDLVQTARDLGYQMQVVPKRSIEEGIQAARALLKHCVFNVKTCKRGIICLDFYRKKWNDNLKVYYDEPLHDQFSHGADAFRYLAVGLKLLGSSGSTKLTADSIKDMRFKHMGY